MYAYNDTCHAHKTFSIGFKATPIDLVLSRGMSIYANETFIMNILPIRKKFLSFISSDEKYSSKARAFLTVG
jgi:hypothetical protein